MRAQVTLTPSESKKLIAKAVAEMPPIKKAMKGGLIVIHPSSTTLFLIEELTGTRPKGVWVCGLILPKGACISWEMQKVRFIGQHDLEKKSFDVGQFPFSWVLENGSFKTMLPLDSLLDKMGEKDLYIKGANAIDPKGKVGVLYGALGGGTIGKVMTASRRKGFTIILPIGLEKLIPTLITKAAKVASKTRTDKAMGIPVGLIPVPGKVVTEVEAIGILSGAEAIVVAAGGLGGAEGSLTLVIQGPEDKVNPALEVIKDIKGATLPEVYSTDCSTCSFQNCHLRVV